MATARLTEQQYAEILAARQRTAISSNSPAVAPKPKTQELIRQSSKTPNQTELAFENDVLYWRKLRGEVIDYYEHGAITLKLANGLKYTPDYPALLIDEHGGLKLTFYEVKGEKRNGRVKARDDAIVKIKIAPKEFPHFRFILTWKDEAGNWQEQLVRE
jgi:hypothetical protein